MCLIIENAEINEKLYYYKLDNNLPVYIIKKENLKTFYMALSIKFGSMDLNYINLKLRKQFILPRGTAHFLEHKLFESAEKDLFERFTKQSAYINAYTNFDSTIYYFSCIENIEKNIMLFLNTIQKTFINKLNVDKEKNIILQEINMYRDNPSSKIYDNLMNLMYKRNYVKYDIGGFEDDVESLNENILNRCFRDFYVPDNMCILIIGNIDENQIIDLINEGWFKKGSINNIRRLYPNEPSWVLKRKSLEKGEVSRSIFAIGFKHNYYGLKGNNLLKRELELNLFLEYLFGNMSPFYEKMYDTNLIDSTFSYTSSINTKYSFTTFSGSSSDPEDVKNGIINEINRIRNSKINKEYINYIKRMLIGNYLKTYDNPSSLINSFLAYENKGCSFFDIPNMIYNVDIINILEELVKKFDNKYLSMSIIAPSTK